VPKYPAPVLRPCKEHGNSVTRDYKGILRESRFSTLYYYNTVS
jgi:hypothetical protein